MGNIFAFEMRWDKSQRRNGCLSEEHVRFVFHSENDGMLSSLSFWLFYMLNEQKKYIYIYILAGAWNWIDLLKRLIWWLLLMHTHIKSWTNLASHLIWILGCYPKRQKTQKIPSLLFLFSFSLLFFFFFFLFFFL